MQQDKDPQGIDRSDFEGQVHGRVINLEAIAQVMMPILEQVPEPGAVLTDEESVIAQQAIRRLLALSGMLTKGLEEFLEYVETIVVRR